MDNLIAETNGKLLEIIDNLTTIKNEYEVKLNANSKEIDSQLDKVEKYKKDFFESKAKIEKMNSDIEGFESDYKKLVERFKDDELANILIAANKEISLKIDERKRKIVKDKAAMNELVDKAENVKSKLVKLTAEKRALELCLTRITDAYEFYSKSLNQIISYSNDNPNNLSACFHDSESTIKDNSSKEKYEKESVIKERINNIEDEEFDDIDEDSNSFDDNSSNNDIVKEDIMSDVEDEEVDELEPVDLSDMIKDEDIVEENLEKSDSKEISDYDNEDVIEGDEHKIVIDENNKEEKNNKKNKKSNESNENKSSDNEDINIDIDVNFDDSLEDDDSLYE